MKKLLISILLGSLMVQGVLASKYSVKTDQDGPSYSYELAPGESTSGVVNVRNVDNHDITLSVSAIDAFLDQNGILLLENDEEPKDHVGGWINLDSEAVTLSPGERIAIPFSLDVPEDALPGQYAGGFGVGQLLGDGSDTFNFAKRIGLYVFLTVEGEITDSVSWDDFSLGFESDASQRVNYQIENTGNSLLELNTIIKVDGEIALERGIGMVAPGQTISPGFELDKKVFGGMDVEAELFYKRKAMVKDDSIEEFSLGTKSLSKFFFPWKEFVIGLISLAFLIGLVFGRKSYFAKVRASMSLYKVKKGEDIMSLAAKYNYSWKKLARINGLKPPYSLKSGDQIYVPKKKK